MKALYMYRLQFRGAARFGTSGIGLEETDLTLSSESLTSAFLNSLAVLDGPDAVTTFLTKCAEGRPPVAFSSLFPYGPDANDKPNIIEAVPRPLCAPVAEDSALRDVGKDLKALKWVRPSDAAIWLGTEKLPAEKLNELVQRSRSLAAAKTDVNDSPAWYAEELRPRIAVDRNNAGTQLWFCASVRFAQDAGLYGLVRIRDDWPDRWLRIMRLLGELGIGGERTYGFGLFDVSEPTEPSHEWKSLINLNSSRRLLLSAYHPSATEREDLAESLVAWNFRESRGYVVSGRHTTTIKRKRVRFLVEGSVLRSSLTGTFVDVTPDNHTLFGLSHRVYRCGIAFTLPQ
jgi:CRISPR-associated protein Csm4